jgi:hypothetical protein
MRALRICCALTLSAISGSVTSADVCKVEALQHIPSPNGPVSTGFAAALDMSGTTIISGDQTDSTLAGQAGAAFIYEQVGGEWTLAQTLHAEDAGLNELFGASVAIDGDTAVVGAWADLNGGILHGAAYVFQRIEGEWIQVAKLFDDSVNDPPDPPGVQNIARQFGRTVAIDGNAILIGAPQDSTLGLYAGAAYVYRFDGKSWAFEQKLLASNGFDFNQFGNGVVIDGNRALVGASGGNAGRVYSFDYKGKAWAQQQEIALQVGGLGASTPVIMSLDGDLAAFGLPLLEAGAASLYHHDGTSWVFDLQLTPEVPQPSERFGSSIAIDGEYMAIGARQYDMTYPNAPLAAPHNDQGVVYVYQFEGGAPVLKHTGYAELLIQDAISDVNAHNQMGAAIALDGEFIVVGSPKPIAVADPFPNSSMHVLGIHPPDCDGNGVPDACDLDCNRNLIPDACDLDKRNLADCDADGEPDVCQTNPNYLLTEEGFGVAYGPGPNGSDFIWLNHFTVQKGHEHITHISTPWTYFVPDGHPVTLMLYDDPNNDGAPHDAVLLKSISVNGFDDFGTDLPRKHTIYAIPRTYVGEVGDSFFVAGFSVCTPTIFPATAFNGANGGHSWAAIGPMGSIDISNLSGLTFPPTPTIKFLLRAYALDCNGNDLWDQCDIDSGFSLDVNLDGLPDECNPQCSEGDLNGTGTVDVDDLLTVINNWGPCDTPDKCAGDATGNGVVDVDDLLNVLNNWGPCI